MPDKAYAILLGTTQLFFPIKRDGLRYGGMPQFFGGTKNAGESDRDTIAREMAEESDQKLSLRPGGLTRVYSTTVNGDQYNFYVATNYTGQHFLGPLQNAEMQSIAAFTIDIGGGDDILNLLAALRIVPTEDFSRSETYTAFDQAIAWSEQDSEDSVEVGSEDSSEV